MAQDCLHFVLQWMGRYARIELFTHYTTMKTTNKPTWTITRRDESTYMAVSDIPLADGRVEQDHMMELSGNVLQCIWKPGVIRIGGNTRLTLGAVSLPKVLALSIGESVTLS